MGAASIIRQLNEAEQAGSREASGIARLFQVGRNQRRSLATSSASSLSNTGQQGARRPANRQASLSNRIR